MEYYTVPQQLHCNLSLKNISEQGMFSGYASVFNTVDSHNDVVEQGAFSKSLKAQKQGKAVKLLWQHRADEPIGFFKTIREDARGLYVEAQLSLEVQRAKEAYSLLKTGAIEGLSIGYNAVEYSLDEETGIRHLSQVELWEVSLVTFPANQAAQVMMVKGEEPLEMVRLVREIDRAIGVIR